MNTFRKNVGKRIREIRRRKDISQESLGYSLGNNSQAYISKIEAGKVNFSIDKLEKIIKLLGVSNKEFFEF